MVKFFFHFLDVSGENTHFGEKKMKKKSLSTFSDFGEIVSSKKKFSFFDVSEQTTHFGKKKILRNKFVEIFNFYVEEVVTFHLRYIIRRGII